MNNFILSVLLLMVGGTTLGMYKKEEIQAVEINNSAALSQEHSKQIKHIHFFNDGRMLSIGQDKAVYWNGEFQKIKEVTWDNEGMPLLVASCDDYIAIAHDYKKVTIYNLDLTYKTEFKFEAMLVDSLCFVHDNQLIAAMTNGTLMLLDLHTNSRQPYILRKDSNNTKVVCLKYNHNKEMLHISWDDGCIGQWDVGMREGLPALALETKAHVTDFAYSQNKLLTVSTDEYLRVWQQQSKLGDYAVQATLRCERGCNSLAVTRDGSLAAVSGRTGVDVFDLINNELIEKIVTLPSRAQKLYFAPNNNLIISSGNKLMKHVINYEFVNPVNKVITPEEAISIPDTSEQRYFAAWQNFNAITHEANIVERISKLKAMLTKSYNFVDASTEKAFRVMIQQKIAASYFDNALAQTHTRDRYNQLQALKNSSYLDCYDYAQKAELERAIQNEINKIGLVTSLWYNWSGKAKHWISSKVNNTLMKLTPILT